MNGSGSPVLGMLGLWMLLIVVFSVALLLGGLYLLYSIGRAAAGLERLADSAEAWIELMKRSQPFPGGPDIRPVGTAYPPVVPPVSPSAPSPYPVASRPEPQSFVPGENPAGPPEPGAGGPR